MLYQYKKLSPVEAHQLLTWCDDNRIEYEIWDSPFGHLEDEWEIGLYASDWKKWDLRIQEVPMGFVA